MIHPRRKFLLSSVATAALPLIAHEDHDKDPAIERVSLIHGGTGPFAIAGYRMGVAALRQLKTNRGNFQLEVVHYSPRVVQWSCIIDGLQAATGASLGKLNLRLEESTPDHVYSIIRNRKTGQQVKVRLTPAFVRAHLNLKDSELAAAGARVTAQPESEIFQILP